MESMWYDKEGKPMGDINLTELRLANPDYKRVASTHVGKDVWVSTVWVGIDMRYDDGPPLIFETMVFGGKHDDYIERYSTESEAKEGHERIVRMVKPWWKRWSVKLRPPTSAP